MALLAAQRSGEASFTEQRWVRGLDAPLASSGQLSYEAPDRLVRRTIEPRPETMAIDGNRVTLTRSGRSRSFSLDAAPELVGLVEAMRATLTGNEAVLRRYFETRLDGNAAQWLLVLTPLEPRLAAQLRQIRIAGRQGQLERVEMDMADGDRSVMLVTSQRCRLRARFGRIPTVNAERARRAPRAGLVVTLWLLALGAAALLIANSRFSADLSAFLPASPDPRQQVLIEQLRSGIAARTLLIAIDGGDAVQRADASRRLAAALRGKHFEQVRNGDFSSDPADPAGEAALGAWLFEHRYRLSPAVAPGASPSRGCEMRSARRCRCSERRPAQCVKATLERDPTGETQRIVEGLVPADSPRTEQGVWVARSAPRALLLGTLKRAGRRPRRAGGCDRCGALSLRAAGGHRSAVAAERRAALRGGEPGPHRARSRASLRSAARSWSADCCCSPSAACGRWASPCCRWPPASSAASLRSAWCSATCTASRSASAAR